jgi:Skp family chaperone for outer membrane proteins
VLTVRNSHLFSLTLVAGLAGVGFFAATALSGQPRPGAAAAPAAGAASTAPPVAVAAIDLSKILKEGNHFNAMMDGMKVEVEAAEKRLNADRQAIADLEEQFKKAIAQNSPSRLLPGSPEYKQREEDLIKRKNDFNVAASIQKKDLMEKETKVYFIVYKEINEEVTKFAQYYNIQMVLRYNSDTPLDGTDRNEVARLMSKPIFYLKPELDITGQILGSLNTKFPKQQQAVLPTPPNVPRKNN